MKFLIKFLIHPKSMLVQAIRDKIISFDPLSQGLKTFWGVCVCGWVVSESTHRILHLSQNLLWASWVKVLFQQFDCNRLQCYLGRRNTRSWKFISCRNDVKKEFSMTSRLLLLMTGGQKCNLLRQIIWKEKYIKGWKALAKNPLKKLQCLKC